MIGGQASLPVPCCTSFPCCYVCLAADSATAVRDVSYTWSSPLLQNCDSRTMTVLLSQVVKLVLHEWHTQTAGWLRCSLVSFKLVPALLYV